MLSSTRQSDLRRRNVLLSHEPDRSALHALLSVEDAQRTNTQRALEKLGFRPEGTNISWVRNVPQDELGATCSRVATELGESALWDLGRVFTNRSHPVPITHDELPRFWQGRFVLHVRATPRCVVFDRAAEDRDIRKIYEAEDEEHMSLEFDPTE